MTIRKNSKFSELGNIFKQKRLALSLKSDTRQYFINNREDLNLMEFNAISLKTLTNIENGKNIPSLQTIKLLAPALEVDTLELLSEIMPLIPIKKGNSSANSR